MKPVLMINPNGSKAATRAMLGIARQHLPHVVSWTNPNGPQMITDPCALALAAEQVARADLPEASGMIVAAFGDPGAAALSARVACPVIGIGRAAARAAGKGGARFAVVTTTPDLRHPIDALMREIAGGLYLGTVLTIGDPLALISNDQALDTALVEACLRARAGGADRVIIGGGPLAASAARIADRVPIPLVQPLAEACRHLSARR
ncbi:MAG: aspartate/glutamate racemase family protein [Marinibacterium sp.]